MKISLEKSGIPEFVKYTGESETDQLKKTGSFINGNKHVYGMILMLHTEIVYYVHQ